SRAPSRRGARPRRARPGPERGGVLFYRSHVHRRHKQKRRHGRPAQLRAGEVLLLECFDPIHVRQNCTTMSLRSEPLEQDVTLPDGRVVAVRVGIAEDSYIPRRELDTVVLELWDASRGEHLAGVATVLSADDVGAARALLRQAVAG